MTFNRGMDIWRLFREDGFVFGATLWVDSVLGYDGITYGHDPAYFKVTGGLGMALDK